jgi:hypothetical protein
MLRRTSLVLLALLPIALGACSDARDGEAAQEVSEVRAAKCTPEFDAELEQLVKLRSHDYSERDVAARNFLWSFGVVEGDERRDLSFVYIGPEDRAYVDQSAATLKTLLTGRYAKLVPAVDALMTKSSAQNLHGAPATTLASSFHCLGAPAQSRVLDDPDLTLDEKPLESISQKMRERFTRDADDASGAWSDTVLEGPYALTDGFEIAIESVEEIRLAGKRIALRVTIGAQAVNSDSCQQSDDETWPEECVRGTISQKLYYDAVLHRITAMEEGAEFVE